eukprot:CAMPEP_0194385516 /NCGR_PEP_ID=MMETSP0174-20130528/80677_1 /TAXON_ID=216777 /ORGANISM="Proboscia alata, Strain PI-D3" /LENGTH=675 /DNA_ID=CAMNT_0039173727 /DNA_START=273 /DNA_END=2300 /DNA_ORIENTATION=-
MHHPKELVQKSIDQATISKIAIDVSLYQSISKAGSQLASSSRIYGSTKFPCVLIRPSHSQSKQSLKCLKPLKRDVSLWPQVYASCRIHPPRLSTQFQRSARWLSTSKDGNKKDISKSKDNVSSSTESTQKKFSSPEFGIGGCSSPSNEYGAIGNIKAAATTMMNKTKQMPNITDILTAVGGFSLLIGIVLGPTIYNSMKTSEETYEETLMIDDDIVNLARALELYYLSGNKFSSKTKSAVSEEEKNHEDHKEETENTIKEKNILLDGITDVLTKVIENEDVQNALIGLVTRVLSSAEVIAAAKILVHDLFTDLINDPNTLAQVIKLLNNAIADPELKKAVLNLILQLVADEEINKALTELVVRLGQEEEVKSATTALLSESAHQTLMDPEILDHSMEFASDVVGDDVVQRTSGEALWNTISYSVRPAMATILSFTGVSLVFFTFVAIGQARSGKNHPSSGSDIISAGFGNQNVNVGKPHRLNGNLRGMHNILEKTGRLLSSTGFVVFNFLTTPFRIISKTTFQIAETVASSGVHAISKYSSYFRHNVIESTRQVLSATKCTVVNALKFPFRIIGTTMFQIVNTAASSSANALSKYSSILQSTTRNMYDTSISLTSSYVDTIRTKNENMLAVVAIKKAGATMAYGISGLTSICVGIGMICINTGAKVFTNGRRYVL